AKMTLVSSRPFHGYTGRSYKITLGDLTGSVNAFVTRKRFYAIVSLNNKKDEALDEKFLSSFVLPDRQPEPPKNVAAGNTEQQPNQPAQPLDPNTQNTVQPEGETAQPATPNNETAVANPPNTPAQPQGQQGQRKPPINGGVLNSKAIYMPV